MTREERIGSSSVDRENDGMANPVSSSQSPAGPAQAQAPPVASFIPVPPRLEMKNGPNPTTWHVWAQRWKAFAAVSRLDAQSDEYQCGMLTSAVDDETLRIIDALPYATESDRKKPDKIIDLLGKYCLQDENIMFERHQFYQRRQNEGETVEHFITDLRTLARTCDFTEDGKDFANQMIRDRLVCGIRNDVVRQRLLAGENPSLSTCIKECRTAEATQTQATEMRTMLSAAGRVKLEPNDETCLRTTTSSTNRSAIAPERQIWRCSHCNRRHGKGRCPAFGQVCRNCGRQNHFAAACSQRAHAVLAGDDPMDTMVGTVTVIPEETGPRINRVSSPGNSTVNAVFAWLEIQSKAIRFQVDSGASCNILRQEDLDGLANQAEILPTSRVLRMYDTSTCTPIGTCTPSVRNPKTGTSHHLEFMVVRKAPVALLGCAASQQLGFLEVHTENIQLSVLEVSDGLREKATPAEGRTHTAEDLIAAYGNVFNSELGKFPAVEHLEIDPFVTPVKMPLRKVPLTVQDRLEPELNRLEKLGVIERVTEPTEWISGMVVTEKKNGSLRVCIDPRPLNKALRRSTYPMLTMEDILPRLSKAKVFTVCDVKNGFWHVQLEEASSLLTTFSTPYGRFKWNRLPFGLSSAPEIFQRNLDQCIQGLPCVARIVDDLLIWGEGETIEKAMQDHDVNVERMLERAQSANLKLNPEKLKYKMTTVKFAGYILTANGGHKPDPEKVAAIVEMPAPQDVAGVRRFLGMTNYFAKYLDGLSGMSEPLRQLTSDKVEWQWTHEQEEAFRKIKAALSSAPLLAFFDKEFDTTAQCDASQSALGAVLMQQGRPITFASRTLTPAEINYAQIEKELLAVVFALERFDHYTFGRKVTVENDHKPLQSIMLKPIASAPKRLQRMLLRLQRYSFDLVYVPGSRLDVADALSRAPVSQLPVTEQSDLETVCAVVDAQLTDRKSQLYVKQLLRTRPSRRSSSSSKKGGRVTREGCPTKSFLFFIYGTNWSTRTA